MLKPSLSLAVLLGLTGCATFRDDFSTAPYYVEPAPGIETAILRFLPSGEVSATQFAAPQALDVVNAHRGTPERVASFGWRQDISHYEPRQTRLEAGVSHKLIVIARGPAGINGAWVCTTEAEFRPEGGHTYTVRQISLKWVNNLPACALQVVDLQTNRPPPDLMPYTDPATMPPGEMARPL